MTKVDAYEAAGVSIANGNEAAARYKKLAKQTMRPEVLGSIGGFAGGYQLDLSRFPEPVLFSGTDGVGTKLKIAFATGSHDTIGIDCVAMCVNDILTSGAEPQFFLDYLSVGKLDVDVAETIVRGIAAGCADAGCALVGGETAEMPGMYADGEYDIAGFAVGVANRPEVVDGSSIRPGDVVIGIASNGIHSNGYSLVRKLVAEQGLDWNETVSGWRGTVAEELLRPTRIYVKPIVNLMKSGITVKGMAHITGGGIVENLPRCLPEGCGVRIEQGAWEVPAVFEWLMEKAGLSFQDAAVVWNMGIGFAVVVDPAEAQQVLDKLRDLGEDAYRIGTVERGKTEASWGTGLA